MRSVGVKIKHLREAQGLSQRALARKARISNGTVSQIESDTLDPTVGLLRKILDALHVSMADFFSAGGETRDRYFFTPADMVEIGRGPISYRQLGPADKSRALQILSERYAPGADTGVTMLSHEGEEGGLIIAGSLEVQVGNQRRLLKAGDGYQFPSRLPHRFRNRSEEPCLLVSACTPPGF